MIRLPNRKAIRQLADSFTFEWDSGTISNMFFKTGLEMIEGVFFDCGNVLIIYNIRLFCEKLESRKRSKIPVPVREILVGPHNSALVDFELGYIDERGFFNRIQCLLDLDMSFDEFMDVFTDGGIMVPDPAMLELKRGLKEYGIKLALVTNNNPVHIEVIRRIYPEVLYGFDYKAISYEMHMRKPDDTEIFTRPARALGLNLENCLLIDDYEPNAKAFRELGGLGYHYNMRDQFLGFSIETIAKERRHFIAMCRNLGLINWPEI